MSKFIRIFFIGTIFIFDSQIAEIALTLFWIWKNLDLEKKQFKIKRSYLKKISIFLLFFKSYWSSEFV